MTYNYNIVSVSARAWAAHTSVKQEELGVIKGILIGTLNHNLSPEECCSRWILQPYKLTIYRPVNKVDLWVERITNRRCTKPDADILYVWDKSKPKKENTNPTVACVCNLTHEAVGVLGTRAAASALAMAAVADVRPEASTVTLLCTHRLSHCPGSGKTEFEHTLPTTLSLLLTLELHTDIVGERNERRQQA